MWRCVCVINAMIHKLVCFLRIGNLRSNKSNVNQCRAFVTHSTMHILVRMHIPIRHYAAWQLSYPHICHTHTATVKYRDTHPRTFIYCIYLCICKQLSRHSNTVLMLDTKAWYQVASCCRLSNSQVLNAKAPHFYRALLLKSLSNFRSPLATHHFMQCLHLGCEAACHSVTVNRVLFCGLIVTVPANRLLVNLTWIRSYAEAF